MAKQAEDKQTAELPLKPTRGRPRKWANDAEKQKAYRERKGNHILSIQLPKDLYDEFQAWVKRRTMDTGKQVSEVLENVIRNQVLRKR
jgi:hypothetical protein